MKVFVVSVNGQVVCRVGIDTEGQISAGVSWPPPESPYLGLSGLDLVTDEFLHWAAPELNVGDEVEIQSIEAETFDPPRREKRGNSKQLEEECVPADSTQSDRDNRRPADATELGMAVFVVSLNGKVVCRPGISASGSIGVDLAWGSYGDLWLGVCGLDTVADEHLRWDVPELHIGDIVTVKIARSDVCDPPAERKTPEELNQERWSS